MPGERGDLEEKGKTEGDTTLLQPEEKWKEGEKERREEEERLAGVEIGEER